MSIISKWNTAFKNSASRYNRDERGQFAVMFAVASFAIVMAGGMALDTARMYSAKSKLDNAVDAAILATTRDLTSGAIADKDAKEAVSKFLFANMDVNGINGVPVVIDNVGVDKDNKTVKIDAHVMLPMTLTAIAGYDVQKVASSSIAEYNDDRVEIAMALDVTGSMGMTIDGMSQTKMEALKAAANSAIDILMPPTAGSGRVRIGLVPYSASVNAMPVINKINYINPLNDNLSNGCVIERTISKPYANNFASSAHPIGGVDLAIGADGCPTNEIVPLSNQAASLKTNIDALGTSGYTAGHVGIAWAQYMLSSTWNSAWPDGSDAAAPTAKKTTKYAIIMTDGEFNTFLSNGDGVGNGAAQSRSYAQNTCNRMKAGLIKVFTINFAGGTQAENLMRNCATPNTGSEQFFYSASDGAQLKKAFEDIAKSIKKLRLIG